MHRLIKHLPPAKMLADNAIALLLRAQYIAATGTHKVMDWKVILTLFKHVLVVTVVELQRLFVVCAQLSCSELVVELVPPCLA